MHRGKLKMGLQWEVVRLNVYRFGKVYFRFNGSIGEHLCGF